MPETYQKNEVRIYEATNFPYNWQYSATLISGREFVDPSVFYYNGTWWMFVSDTTDSNCYLYYSDDLFSGWTEHPMSPIVRNDASKARPGGRSFVYNGNKIIRTTQKCDVDYGEKVRAFQIDILTKNNYAEHEISESPILSASGSGWNASGMHQFDPWWTGSEWICSVDGDFYATDGNEVYSIGILTSTVPSGLPVVLPHSGWTLKYVDSQELKGEDGAATNAFDGNSNTFWHTQWLTANPLPPHEIQIDLGNTYTISGFRYLPRQDDSPNGMIGQYEFYVSVDGITWDNAIATGTFANNATEKEVSFNAKVGRYIRLRALTEVNSNPWTSMAEFNVLIQQ